MAPTDVADPEADLVRRAQSGDTRAWDALVGAHREPLLRLAQAILRDGDEARDVVQDAFSQAVARLGDFDASTRFDLWMRRLVVNRSRDVLRRRGVREAAAAELATMPAAPVEPAALISARETSDRILRAVESLPIELRQALVAHILEGRPYAELAEILDISVNAARIRVHRALARLRERLKEEP